MDMRPAWRGHPGVTRSHAPGETPRGSGIRTCRRPRLRPAPQQPRCATRHHCSPPLLTVSLSQAQTLPLLPMGFAVAGTGSLSLTSPASSPVPNRKCAAMQQCRLGVLCTWQCPRHCKQSPSGLPGSPVATTTHSQCRGPRLDSWSGN